MAVYETIGRTYAATRRPDPRIDEQIRSALRGMRSLINVGAGGGSYEPPQTVLAVDPSSVMLRQRPTTAAPAVQAWAEALPITDRAADAAMASLTVHHWSDVAAGITELRRIARRRVVILTWDQRVTRDFWLMSEYLPVVAEFEDQRAVPVPRLVELLGGARIGTVPVPHDCTDGFGPAYWRRPAAYLDPVVRAGMSMLAQHDDAVLRPGLQRLAADLASGSWHRRHRDLMELECYDAGYRLLVADA